jgi:hypothetical protein
MIQPNLRMTDARGLDGRALVRRCVAHGANAILANGGGIVAWYPTNLPWHWRNPLLDRDYVGEVTAEARRRDVRVLLRMDWSCLVPEIGRLHPDWLALDADGAPRVEWPGTSRPLLRTCPNRPYWRRHAFRGLEELMSRYPFDGFFFNAWDLPDCRCPECQAECRKALGQPIPRRIDWESSFGRAYLVLRAARHAAFTKDLAARIRRFSPPTLLSVDFHLTNDNPHHLGRAAWDGALLADAVDLVTVEAFNFLSRPRPHWGHWADEEAKMIRCFPQGKPGIVLLSGSERGMGRRPAQPPDQIAANIRQITEHGAIPCVAVSGDFRQEDPAVFPVVKRVYRALARRRAPTAPPSTRAKVALVYGQRTMDLYGGEASRERALFHYRGWYEALDAAGVVFTVVHDGVLAEVLGVRRDLRTLILPNVACLSDADCRAVDAWVRAGGTLVADFETSRYDESGRRRPVGRGRPGGFGLRCLGRRPGKTVKFGGSWFDVGAAARPWTGGDARILPVAGEFLETRGARRGVLNLLEWTYNNKPEWSQPDRATDQDGLYVSRVGRGRVRYLPWAPGKLFHLCGSPAHARLMYRLARA